MYTTYMDDLQLMYLFSLADQKASRDEENFQIKREQGKLVFSRFLPPSQGLLIVSTLKLKDR